LRKISADFAYQKPRWTADSRRQLRQRLLRCPFQVELAVPSLRVALGELAHLEPGSILVLPQAASSAATFSIVNQQAFAANPARRGNIRVAQLLHRLPTSEKEERP
jgi:flagellar motor switch protein FliM